MHLNLSIGGQVLAKVPLDPTRCKDQHYLNALCRLLSMKHHAVIAMLKRKPSFYIEVPSHMESLGPWSDNRWPACNNN
jgi:hypothetical protein